MKLLLVFASGIALAAVPRGAHAQVSGGASVDLSFGSPPGEAIDSTDVFYDQLAPYGMWVDDQQAGRVFIPDQADFVPYTNGHWEYTDLGFVWISSEPFAAVTSHYGRWWYSDAAGRWEWVPGTEWAPAWVDWRQSGDDYGWSPMAPDFASSAGYRVPVDAWHFAPARHLVDADVDRYYVPRDRVTTIVREAQPIQRYASVGNARVAVGPAPATLRAKGIQLRAQKVEPKAIGRMQAADLRAATARARTRLPQIEAQNRQRVESNAKLRQVARPATDLTKPAPARNEARPNEARPNEARPNEARPNEAKPMPETKRAEPARPEPRATQPRANENRLPEAKPATPRAEPARPMTRPEPRANEAKPMPEAKPATPRAEPQSRVEPQRTAPRMNEPKAAQEPKRAEPQARNQAKPEPKAQAKPEPKAEPKAQAKAEPKAKAKAEPRPEPKAQAKAEPRPEPKAQAKAEPKPAAKPESKVQAKAEPKAERKPDRKPEK